MKIDNNKYKIGKYKIGNLNSHYSWLFTDKGGVAVAAIWEYSSDGILHFCGRSWKAAPDFKCFTCNTKLSAFWQNALKMGINSEKPPQVTQSDDNEERV